MMQHETTALTLTVAEGVLTAVIAGEIDHHGAYALREGIDLALCRERPRILVLDFSRVGFMDSSGLGLILGRLSIASELGTTLRLTGISAPVMKILLLAGTDRLPGLEIEGIGI